MSRCSAGSVKGLFPRRVRTRDEPDCIRSIIPKIKGASPGEVRVAAPYRKLKLFLLAILWRAGVATGPTWDKVDLGAHEPTLRSMLANEVPGGVDEFRCLAVASAKLNRFTEVIPPPTRGTIAGVPVVQFIFFGIRWTFFLHRCHAQSDDVCRHASGLDGRGT